MNIEAKRKYMLVGVIILLVAALVAGTSSLWKGSAVESRKQGYVAVIRIDGPIYGGPDTDSLLSGSSGVTSEQIMKEFQAARKDPEAKAILVRINSPGGSTGATQEIAEEMDKIRSSGKPIIISMGDMCASAGYWLASKGNYIFASPATITGSIGVYMDYTNVEDLMGKLGVKNEKIKSGAHKDILSMYRPMTGEEKEMVQTMVDDIYNQFVQTVADGRKMDESKVRAIADGRILTGKQAQDLGLVDAMGNYYDALSYAASSGGIQSENIPVKSYGSGVSLRNILSGEAKTMAGIFADALADSFKKSVADASVPAVK
ncbi:signal peptide peptidase SppA [uncultured Dialister sp.]|uniref:signal peptide peptidase SppA n=1 Tax=uncultured Dialister sp. TaxID=278064 RepID=UPI002636FF4E|nr:signal peptide peptidase SppA [uncultured Dialister sp.]